MDRDLQQLDRVCKALADPTRLRIVGLLQAGEVCVCHIHESLKIPQPKASRHLAYLRRTGVVQAEKRGLWVYYRMAPQASPVAQTMLDIARHCVTHLASSTRDRERLEHETGCCAVPIGAPDVTCCGSSKTETNRRGRSM